MLRKILQYTLPHKFISWIAHTCADCRVPWIKNYLIDYFVKRYPVRMWEAVESNPFAYATYNDFFTRRLRAECRPIDPASDVVVSPADGAIAQIGLIEGNSLLQAKGHYFTVQALLGGSDALANNFVNGNFVTVYLAPKDYHRVHMPFTGKLLQMTYVPGNLFSVNTHAAENIPGLFARNERVVCIFETEIGKMAVVLVGAMIVGSMCTVWHGDINPTHSQDKFTIDYVNQAPIILRKGEELGLFKLGSTVIVLTEANKIEWHKHLVQHSVVNMGLSLGVKV